MTFSVSWFIATHPSSLRGSEATKQSRGLARVTVLSPRIAAPRSLSLRRRGRLAMTKPEGGDNSV